MRLVVCLIGGASPREIRRHLTEAIWPASERTGGSQKQRLKKNLRGTSTGSLCARRFKRVSSDGDKGTAA